MYQRIRFDFQQELVNIKKGGLSKEERVILSDQKPEIGVSFPKGKEPEKVLNFCANNYLGLANNQEVIKAAQDIMNEWGFGLSSVRFICGTQQI
ncbi:MAG: glycine C-acetyltransferase, partial [Candidatus Aminicenantes bacterium]|nr:glycine C-acetyltransferase [Candidatus Aminicenantes bacterium]